VVIYDGTYDPAVTGAIAVNARFDMPELNAGEHAFIIDKLWFWPSYNLAGAPADMAYIRPLIDGEEWPPAPARFYLRARADRNMAVPYDERYAVCGTPLGEISTDPLKDTTLKVAPAQRLSFRLVGGPAAGLLVTDSPLRIRSQTLFARTSLMATSPIPVAEQAPASLSAYVPHPINGESPIRPGNLSEKPPVDVAAAVFPSLSSATAPTVSVSNKCEWDSTSFLSFGR